MKMLDPLQVLRRGLDGFEARVNAITSRQMMASPGFAQKLDLLATVSIGLHHVCESLRADLYARLDLPSRSELRDLAAAVRRVEDKLEELLPPREPAAAAHPPRTRRPGSGAAAAAAKTAAAPTKAPTEAPIKAPIKAPIRAPAVKARAKRSRATARPAARAGA
ncbi:MAG: hypothetical protein LCI02_28790 [Proteobacteria bacterium]|nr:hypothetical protein [Pseudomonadota bacterium]